MENFDRLALLAIVFKAAGWRLISDVFVLHRDGSRLGPSSPHLPKTDSYLLTPDTVLMLLPHAEGVIVVNS